MLARLEKEVDMLNRHLLVLQMVLKNEPIRIETLVTKTGYPSHKVRYSLRVLEEENIIRPSSQGAITTDDTAAFVNEFTATLDEVIELLNSMKIDERPELTH